MPALLTALAWVAVHLATYAALRRRRAFGSEKGILGYHVLSCAGLAAALLAPGLGVGAPDRASAVVAALSLHGIYSMSFLVLWSSSEGGFSLRMLKALEGGPRTRAEILDEFVRLGDEKRSRRLSSLRQSGWVRQVGDHYRPTAAGVALAWGLVLLHRINHFERTG